MTEGTDDRGGGGTQAPSCETEVRENDKVGATRRRIFAKEMLGATVQYHCGNPGGCQLRVTSNSVTVEGFRSIHSEAL